MNRTRRALPPRISRSVPAFVLASLLFAGPFGCSDGDPTDPGNDDVPASHTLSLDGVRHHPDLCTPETNCVACHGADLRGGEGPSCFTCHGDHWNRAGRCTDGG